MLYLLRIILVATICGVVLNVSAQGPGTTLSASKDPLFSKGLDWLSRLNQLRKISGPTYSLAKADEIVRELPNGGTSGLATEEFIKEAKRIQREIRAIPSDLSPEQRELYRKELSMKLAHLETIAEALNTVSKDLKSAIRFPVPRLSTAPTVLERLYFIEIPVCSRSLASLKSTIASKLRDLESRQSVPEKSNGDSDSLLGFPGVFSEIERRQQELELDPLPKNAEEFAVWRKKVEREAKEIESETIAAVELANFLHQKATQLPQSERWLAEELVSTSQQLAAFVHAKIKLRATLFRQIEEAKIELGIQDSPATTPTSKPDSIDSGEPAIPNSVFRYLEEKRAAAESERLAFAERYFQLQIESRRKNAARWKAATAYLEEWRRLNQQNVLEVSAAAKMAGAELETALRLAESRAGRVGAESSARSREIFEQNRAALIATLQEEERTWQELTAEIESGTDDALDWLAFPSPLTSQSSDETQSTQAAPPLSDMSVENSPTPTDKNTPPLGPSTVGSGEDSERTLRGAWFRVDWNSEFEGLSSEEKKKALKETLKDLFKDAKPAE